MARHKDVQWGLPEPKVETWEQVSVAVLMDIRDELQRLNTLLHCGNFVGIPSTLKSIRRAMPAKKPRRGVRA